MASGTIPPNPPAAFLVSPSNVQKRYRKLLKWEGRTTVSFPTFLGCDGMDGILTIEGFDTSLAEGLMLLTPFAADAQDEKIERDLLLLSGSLVGHSDDSYCRGRLDEKGGNL